MVVILSHPLSAVRNKSCYLCIWRNLRTQPLTLSSLLHRLASAASVRSGAKMTFYDDIYPFYVLQRTSFIFSGSLLTIILVFLVLAVSLLLILPGIRGKTVSAAHPISYYSLRWHHRTSELSAIIFDSALFPFPSEAVLDVSYYYQLVHRCGDSGWVLPFRCCCWRSGRFSFSCRRHWPLCAFSAALNFTSDWAEARMTTNATYKSFSNVVVNAEIGLHVGLYGINVTLKGESQFLLFCAELMYNSLSYWQL